VAVPATIAAPGRYILRNRHGETAMADKKKRDLRDGMLERGPMESGGDPVVPLDYDDTDIVRPDAPPPDGQTTHQ
jgi:hypothetical protein